MLKELIVEDLGVIDRAELTLEPGTTALTGETGAGKTLLVAGLSLLLGGRADRGWCERVPSAPWSRAASKSTPDIRSWPSWPSSASSNPATVQSR